MFTAALDTGREAQQLRIIKAGSRPNGRYLRPALGQCARLVDDDRVDLFEALQRLGILDQHAALRAAADANHHRHGRGESECAGTGDDEHGDGGDHGVGEARLGAPNRPGGESKHSNCNDQRHEPGAHLIRKALDRGTATLGLGHHLHDTRQNGVAPDFLGAHHESARLVHRAADDGIADALGDRHRFARDHRLVDGAAPFDDLTIDRDTLAGPDTQEVTDRDKLEPHILLAAVRIHAARRFGREVQQSADCAAGALASPQLQHLAEQYEHDDYGRGLEVDADRTVRATETFGE